MVSGVKQPLMSRLACEDVVQMDRAQGPLRSAVHFPLLRGITGGHDAEDICAVHASAGVGMISFCLEFMPPCVHGCI